MICSQPRCSDVLGIDPILTPKDGSDISGSLKHDGKNTELEGESLHFTWTWLFHATPFQTQISYCWLSISHDIPISLVTFFFKVNPFFRCFGTEIPGILLAKAFFTASLFSAGTIWGSTISGSFWVHVPCSNFDVKNLCFLFSQDFSISSHGEFILVPFPFFYRLQCTLPHFS